MVGVFVELARRTIGPYLYVHTRILLGAARLSNLKKGFSGRISRRIYDGQGDPAPDPARRIRRKKLLRVWALLNILL